jgi:hypothetical protein
MKFKWRNVLIAVGLILAVVLLVDFNRRIEELDRLNAKLKTVRVEGTAVMQTQVALITQVAYATSDSAVEEWAYNNKWTRSGEHAIELVPAGNATSMPQSIPQTSTDKTPPWRIWWELFFGGN